MTETGVPVYLLIDRDEGTVTVHSDPENGRYSTIATHAYGHTVKLPELGITLETDVLKNYTR